MKAYKFRVVIDTDEDVFRDIVILENQNFEDLHFAVIHAFGFEGDQMASFYMSNEEWEKGEEIGLMDMSFGDEKGPKNMKSTQIESQIESKHQKILYVYDFLKMWIFLIELIGVQEETPDAPQLVLSVGTNPKEDSKELSDDFQMITESIENSEDDDFGFNDFEDGFSDDDLNSLN